MRSSGKQVRCTPIEYTWMEGKFWLLHTVLRGHGVRLKLGSSVAGFEKKDGQLLTLLENEEPLHSDMVLLAIGVTPDTVLSKEAGLELGVKGSIVVNDRMETSVPEIYAVGDAVEVTHLVSGQRTLISLAGPANKQGRIAADNICGGDSKFRGSIPPQGKFKVGSLFS